MQWKFISDISEFSAMSEPLLLRDEAANGLILGISTVLRAEPARTSILAVLLDGGRVIAAALQVKEANLVLTKCPSEAVERLALEVSRKNTEPPGVVGPGKETELFARKYAELTRKKFILGVDQMIYRLTRIAFAPSVKGQMRPAGLNEIDIVGGWLEDFREESIPHENADTRRSQLSAEKRVRAGEIFVWEVNGRPVCMAGIAGPTKNGIRINAVFTPRNRRGKGYATALVEALSRKMLESGKTFCCLYTDVSNPTSNGIYTKIGYQAVSDSRHYVFV